MFLLQEPPFKFLRGDAPGDAEAKSLLAFVFTFSQQLPAATGSSPASSERYIINEAREPKWTDVFLLFFNSLLFFFFSWRVVPIRFHRRPETERQLRPLPLT